MEKWVRIFFILLLQFPPYWVSSILHRLSLRSSVTIMFYLTYFGLPRFLLSVISKLLSNFIMYFSTLRTTHSNHRNLLSCIFLFNRHTFTDPLMYTFLVLPLQSFIFTSSFLPHPFHFLKPTSLLFLAVLLTSHVYSVSLFYSLLSCNTTRHSFYSNFLSILNSTCPRLLERVDRRY